MTSNARTAIIANSTAACPGRIRLQVGLARCVESYRLTIYKFPRSYWISTGGANGPSAGADGPPATVVGTRESTKHPLMVVLVVPAGSMYISANPSIVKDDLPADPVKSTAGTTTRHGSSFGISVG